MAKKIKNNKNDGSLLPIVIRTRQLRYTAVFVRTAWIGSKGECVHTRQDERAKRGGIKRRTEKREGRFIIYIYIYTYYKYILISLWILLLLLLLHRETIVYTWKRPQSVDEINRDAEIETAGFGAPAASSAGPKKGREETDHTRCTSGGCSPYYPGHTSTWITYHLSLSLSLCISLSLSFPFFSIAILGS